MFTNQNKERIIRTFMGYGYSLNLENDHVVLCKNGVQPFLLDINAKSDEVKNPLVAQMILMHQNFDSNNEIRNKLKDGEINYDDCIYHMLENMEKKFTRQDIRGLEDRNLKLIQELETTEMSDDTHKMLSHVYKRNNDLIDVTNIIEDFREEIGRYSGDYDCIIDDSPESELS